MAPAETMTSLFTSTVYLGPVAPKEVGENSTPVATAFPCESRDFDQSIRCT